MTLPEWLTLSQAAAVLGVHPTTLRRWADNGAIPVRITPGGHRRFLQTDLAAHLEQEQKVQTQPAPMIQVQDEEQKHHMTGRVWGDFALVETRQRLVDSPTPHWLAVFDEAHRDEKRELGRRLMALLIQHISAPDNDQELLIEAKSIATRYAQNCHSAGLTAAEGLQATTFFRDAMTEVALQIPQVAAVDNNAQLRLLRKLNEIFNVVQVSLVEYYDARPEG
ncbi:MAG: helix-turn-helix domain-containing protein [Anaerolineae bacterium]|nr:helix-turn-helix domain-containing protein [Anaerolineae bacterium]